MRVCRPVARHSAAERCEAPVSRREHDLRPQRRRRTVSRMARIASGTFVPCTLVDAVAMPHGTGRLGPQQMSQADGKGRAWLRAEGSGSACRGALGPRRGCRALDVSAIRVCNAGIPSSEWRRPVSGKAQIVAKSLAPRRLDRVGGQTVRRIPGTAWRLLGGTRRQSGIRASPARRRCRSRRATSRASLRCTWRRMPSKLPRPCWRRVPARTPAPPANGPRFTLPRRPAPRKRRRPC